MPNRFPNTVQSAVLFEKRGFFSRGSGIQLEELAKAYFELQAARSGHRFNIVEHDAGKVIQFYGGTDLMIRLEFMASPANAAVFAGTLSSPFTRMALPEAGKIIEAHGTHLLINVRTGVLPELPPHLAAMVSEAGIKEGYSWAQFRQRLETCATLTSLAHNIGKSSLVHWTQSNMLLKPSVVESMANEKVPTLFHVHPRLYQEGEANGAPNVGFMTHGVQHFIGREIVMQANPIPWVENYQAALAFLSLAVTENGYIIPDGDNFGVEGGDFSYKVKHIAETNSGEAATPGHFELDLRYSQKHKYQSPRHAVNGPVIDTANPPSDLVNTANPTDQEMMEEWQRKRALAERVGGQFQVTAPASVAASQASGPRVFGKRTLN